MQSQLIDTNALNITSSIWAIGPDDTYKARAILQVIGKIATQPSEIFVVDPDRQHEKIYKAADISIASQLFQIRNVVNELIVELQDRQRSFNIYKKLEHPIVCVLAFDRLHETFERRADELGLSYKEKEEQFNGAISMLMRGGPEVGIYIIGVSDLEVEGFNCPRLYSGTEALKFAMKNMAMDSEDAKQIAHAKNPACLVVGNQVCPLFDCDGEEVKQIISSKRAIDLTVPGSKTKSGLFQNIFNSGRNK